MKCDAYVEWGVCHREATQTVDGRQLCNVHAAARRRSIAANERLNQRLREERAADDVLKARVQTVAERLGISVGLEYSTRSTHGNYTGRATVPLEWLEALPAAPQARMGRGAEDAR